MGTKEFPYIKHYCRPRFRHVFNSILWNRQLTHGAKVFAMALLTVPPQSRVNIKKMCRKMLADPAVISRWRKQLFNSKVFVRPMEKVVTKPHQAQKPTD
jgi:hypothetical protein